MTVQFGDRVFYRIPGYGADLGHVGEGTVIGVHAEWPEIVCVATEQYTGMTISESLCTKTGEALADAQRFRARYEDLFPGFLAADPV